MRIRMLVGIGGADFSLSPGEETELFSEADATALIASGQAEAVDAKSVAKPKKAAEKKQEAA